MSVVNQPDTSDDDIEFTQAIRKRIIKKLIDEPGSNNDTIPVDKDSQQMLTAVLDGMDRTTLGKKRIATDTKIGDADRQAALLIASIYAKAGGKNPFLDTEASGHGLPEHPSNFINGEEITEGELEQGATNFK